MAVCAWKKKTLTLLADPTGKVKWILLTSTGDSVLPCPGRRGQGVSVALQRGPRVRAEQYTRRKGMSWILCFFCD